MKGKSQVLEIDKCVVSRLWYTTWIVLLEEAQYLPDNYTRDQILHFISLIETEINSQHDLEDRWIISKILEILGVNALAPRPDLTEFNLALKLTSENVSDVEEELLGLFEEVSVSKSVKKKINKISEQALKFLETNLEKYPSVTCFVIESLLCVWSPFFNESDAELQNLYVNCLRKYLPDNENAGEKISRVITEFKKEQTAPEDQSYATLLSVLSKLELTEALNDQLLAWLFPALFINCKSRDIALALYARKSNQYFNEWLLFENKILGRSEIPDGIENSFAISNALFNFNNSGVEINPRELAYRTIKLRRHWLLDILDICYALLATGSPEKVSTLLSVPILQTLWPTVFFKVLENLLGGSESSFGNDEEVSSNLNRGLRFVLGKCAPFFQTGDGDVWGKLQSDAENQLDIVDWVLRNRKITSEKDFRKDLTAKHVFSLLTDHGILSTLNATTNFHQGSFPEVLKLLEHSPESTATFKAYRSMLSALRAILLSDSYLSKAREVGECLTDMRNTLKDLFPLDVRLEAIENIFSLLFLRHEDFFNVEINSEESEEETEEIKLREEDYKRIQSGFVCNKYLIRDLLHYLKGAISDAENEAATLKTEPTQDVKDNLSNVSKAHADAVWRLELLTSPEFARKVGHGGIETNFSDVLLTKKLNASKILTNKSTLYRQEESSSSEDYSKSEVDFSSDAGSLENSNSYSGGRKKHGKKNLPDKSLAVRSNYSFILNFMLSSRESLIIQCLWKCDFDKAQQVIEMFSSGDSQLDAEVRFSKAICQFRQRMRENVGVQNQSAAKNKNEEISTLQNIRQAVQEGIQTSRLTGQLETFLASNKTTLRLINPDEVNTNEILTMAVLDLALTTGHSRACSLNACEVATKYLKSCKMIEKTIYSTSFSKICKLFYESKLDAPLPDILCDSNIPLSVQKFNEKSEFWNEVDKVVRIFGAARLQRGKFSQEHSLQNQETLALISGLVSEGEPYLKIIFQHLDVLKNMLPKIDDGNSEPTPFDMLEQSVHSYFGRQFFELGVPPEELEIVAKKLGVNLVHSILVSCCPKFTFHEKTGKISPSHSRGYLVLNENFQDTITTQYDVDKPNECVGGILKDLLAGIGRICGSKSTLRYTDLQNLSRNTAVQDTLERTSCLGGLNLCELSAGNETLAFFLNVWNLLFLHSMLTVWSNVAPCNRLQHVISASKIAYQIGDLGLVTLATLRSKLLGNLAWDLEFFKQIEDVNEVAWLDLDLDQDPRVIFAMANEFFGTPAIFTYEAANLDEALNKAIHNYIADYNLIEPASDETDVDTCWLPESVCRYQDFLLANASLACQTFGSNLDESFTLRKFLNTSEKNLDFKYRPLLYQYEIRLNYSGDKSGINNEVNVRRSSSNVRQTRTIDENLLQYFEGHCWLLSYLVQRIHHEKSPTNSAKACENAGRCACLENLLRSPWTELLRNTFDENQASIGMHENVSPGEIWTYFESLVKKEKWKRCLDVVNSLPDNLTINNGEISTFKDKVLCNLVSAQASEGDQVLEYLRQIKNIHVLAHAVLANLKRWPSIACEQALTHLLNHSEKSQLPMSSQLQISATLSRVSAFNKMLPHFENNSETKHITWYGIASATNKSDTLKIVKSLIDANKFELCLEWLKFNTFSTEMQSLVTKDLLIGLLENDRRDFEPARKLLQALPVNRSLKLCNGVLRKLESVSAIKFVNSYLLDHCKPGETVKYHRTSISIEILSRLEPKERPAFIHLLKKPLLMLEQLLMNGKFEVLNKILNTASESLPKAGISLEDIDKIVRYYAGKSLEFRVALQRDGIESKSRDSSSLSTEMENTEFVMPARVPTKDEWVPNDKSRVCSCCKSVVFSMFNRRHHCRRCGRVVCAVCSQQRMRVPTYPDSVHVRVCDDCKRQSVFRTQQQHGAPSTPSSETFDYWRMTTDKTHNQTVKDEFSFEHAPSISLCLAILNLHSDHKAYVSFLLDRCDEIKQLLRPVGSGRANPEVDHKLLVKMIRSLVVAAKVKCAKLSLNAGLDNCDRMLSHVDLVSTLVQSDCSALVPSDKFGEHALRRLRDLLTEKEQWILALDVSTKSGLDRQGVWAAWGKAYLKVGCYDQAREKFAHCLDKVSKNGFEDWVFLPNSNQSETSPKKNENQKAREKTRPAKNPPLLTEILQIIEGSTFNRQSRKALSSKSFTAHDISVTLNNIKAISQGRYQDPEPASNTDNSYYHESLHYLLSYGSHSGILEFFIRHDKFEDCLLHVLDNKVDPETFFNSVYLPCLKNGCVEKLHEAMRARDSSLITWRNYLTFTCHSLETKKLLNTLYQLQIFTKDYVRASMSCIRFYVNGANSYTDLCNRSKYLHQAQKHLETELQAQSFGPKRRKSTGSQHSGQSSLTLELEISDIDRHINTISRQMEIAKFLRNSEQEGRDARKFLNELSNMENESSKNQELPTLFGTQLQKTQLAVLAILCGRDVEEGFGIAFRIIQDYNLRSEKVYSLAGHILASEEKISSVEQLVKCCRSSGAPDTNALSDRVLAHCVKLVLNSGQIEAGSGSKDKVDSLIKLITDLELKISMCIESRQLKAAYLLAVRHSRAQDVRKIFKEADRLEQNAIKAICAKWLQQSQKS